MNLKSINKAGLSTAVWLLVILAGFVDASVHDGETPDCNGCHSIDSPDPSSLCLSCHSQKFRVLSDNGNLYIPGGDFFWLSKSYRDVNYISTGPMHGHNIVAKAYNLSEDPLRFKAPGVGSSPYMSGWLGCTSCHDPHQRRSQDESGYRLLGDIGYNGGSRAQSFDFKNPAPSATAPLTSFGDWVPESDSNHPVYISGMSEWCENCHQGYISVKGLSHPAGANAKLKELANNYRHFKNSERKGENLSYDFLVPFELGDKGFSIGIEGPTQGANVMCLTCHRAHASAFKSIGRWDLKIQSLLAKSPVLSTPEGIHAYYGQSITSRYGKMKKSLCSLCHPVD